MATITVLDSGGVERTVNTLPAPGSAADAASLPVSQSTEDKAVSAATKTAAETLAGAIDATKMKAKVADGDDAAIGAKADAAATTDAGTFSLIALFKRLLERVTTLVKAAGQAAMAASHPVVIASDQSAVAVKTSQIVKSQTFTRPSDATPYAANDVVGPTGGAAVGVLTGFFSANGASGYLSKFELFTDQAANVASYRIHFFNTPPTAIADNATFPLVFTDMPNYLNYVDISNMSQEGAGGCAGGFWTGQLSMKAAAADTDLYYVITTKSAFTPASAQQYTAKGTNDSNG